MCACASLISLPAFFPLPSCWLWLYLSVPLPLYLSSSLALSLFLLLFPSFFPLPPLPSPLLLSSLSTLYKYLSPFSLTHPMAHKMHIKKTKTARGMRARRRGGRRRGRTLVYHAGNSKQPKLWEETLLQLLFPFLLPPLVPGQSKGFFAASWWGISYLALRWSSQTYISPINILIHPKTSLRASLGSHQPTPEKITPYPKSPQSR